MNKASLRIQDRVLPKESMLEMKRDMSVWRALGGIWKGKKIKNPVLWQRKNRQEWERVLP